MSDTYKKSQEIFEKAKKLIPNGGGPTRIPESFIDGPWPIYMKKALGPYFWDVDDNKYIDYLCAFGPVILGYSNPKVNVAVIEQIKNGHISGLSSPIQNTLAEKLIQLIPCAERVCFQKSGSDACSVAVRLARAYTGRDKIIRWGYHGWHDWALGKKGAKKVLNVAAGEKSPFASWAGVPKCIRELTYTFEYNNLDSLEKVLEENKREVACIIMMPFDVDLPKKGFLEGVRELANKYDVVLIFDEVRSFLWMGLGGAQKYFGVTPDLTVVSKAMANGYPLSAVVGRKDIMEASVFTSGTYWVSSLEMAASLATIKELEETKAIEKIWYIGEKFQKGLNNLVEKFQIEAEVVGVPCQPFLRFKDSRIGAIEKKTFFYLEAARRGVFFHPYHHWFITASHTDEIIDQTLEILTKCFEFAKKETSKLITAH